MKIKGLDDIYGLPLAASLYEKISVGDEFNIYIKPGYFGRKWISGYEFPDNLKRSQIENIRNISFSPDGKRIIFDRVQKNKVMINMYDLETGELSAYEVPQGEQWQCPSRLPGD